MVISSFLERKVFVIKENEMFLLLSAHYVSISCLECRRGTIQGPFIFSPVIYVFLTMYRSLPEHKHGCSLSWMCFAVNKYPFGPFLLMRMNNELRIFVYPDTEFSLNCLENVND